MSKANRCSFLILLAWALLLLCPTSRADNAAAHPVAARLKALNDLLHEQWEWQLKDSPVMATMMGDYRYNDQLGEFSLAHFASMDEANRTFLKRFQAIDTHGFSEQDRLNKELMVLNLKDALRSYELKEYELPLDQFFGIHIGLPQIAQSVPLDSVRHYEDYLARLRQVPAQLKDVIEIARKGAADGLMPPRFLLEKVGVQCRDIAAPAGQENAFVKPVTAFPDSIPGSERKRLLNAFIAVVDGEIRPAYVKLAEFVEKEYAPKGRTEPGLWSLPNGAARYRFAIHQMTTTEMDAERIHQLGLSEVKRIEAEMSAIAVKLGYADLKSMRSAMKSDPKFFATSRQQILDLFSKYIDQMQAKLPELFGLLPKAPVEVKPTQEFREKEASSAEYQQGTPDGSQPGKVFVNTGDFSKRSLRVIESTAYHEGVPGHHMQIAIAQTLPGLPPFRQQAGYGAYSEGWALYAEQLGKEVGLFQDPVNDYGHLSEELLRACRLVLDTGVHYKRWSREQMVAFFREHSSEDEPSIQAETDRYIVAPAQALCYKLGQLKILELRGQAKRVLGDRFDIRAFHDHILNGGALPLNVLQKRFEGWLNSQKSAPANH